METQRKGENMPSQKETIKLTYEPSAGYWMMGKGTAPLQGPQGYPTLEVPENHIGKFTFVIQGTPGVKFAGSSPFVPKQGKSNPSDFADQFMVIPDRSGKKLTVIDLNENANGGQYNGGNYDYELRFDNGTTLDPIITNNGCCRSFSQAETIAYGIAAVAVLALAVMAYRSWRAR